MLLSLCAPVLAQQNAHEYLQQGVRDYQNKRYLEASKNFEKAVELDPKLPEAYYWRGTADYRDEQAIADFNRAIELKPDYAAAFYARGLKRSLGSKDDAALVDFNTAIKLDPRMVDAYLGRALIFYIRGDIDKTLADYTKIIELRPDGSSYYCRGLAYLDFGKPQPAIDDLSKSIKLDPSYYWSYVQRAKAYRKVGKTALAVTDEKKAAQIGPPQIK